MLKTNEREGEAGRPARRPRPVTPPPRACLLDWLFTLAIGLHVTGIAVCLVMAASQEAWWCWGIRTATGAPLIVLSGALVARSLKRAEQGY